MSIYFTNRMSMINLLLPEIPKMKSTIIIVPALLPISGTTLTLKSVFKAMP